MHTLSTTKIQSKLNPKLFESLHTYFSLVYHENYKSMFHLYVALQHNSRKHFCFCFEAGEFDDQKQKITHDCMSAISR